MTSRSASRTRAAKGMDRAAMAKSAHARSGLRASARHWPRPFLGAGDDSDDVDICETVLGPDKTAVTPSA